MSSPVIQTSSYCDFTISGLEDGNSYVVIAFLYAPNGEIIDATGTNAGLDVISGGSFYTGRPGFTCVDPEQRVGTSSGYASTDGGTSLTIRFTAPTTISDGQWMLVVTGSTE